jgi:hypothetical protein
VEANGSQWVDTGVIMSSSKTVEVDFQLTHHTTVKDNTIMSGYADAKGFVFGVSSSNNKFQFAYGHGWNGSALALDYERHIAVANDSNGNCTLDGNILATQSNIVNSLEPNRNIFLLQFNYNDNFGYAKIYSCKIWDNDVLVRDFKPCIDKNGIYCLYDLVERKFYYSQGTQNFRGDGWQPKTLEYIESTGTQYIDTGYYTNKNSEFVLDGYLTSSGLLFGSGTDGQFVSACIMNHTNVYRARWRGNATSNVDMASTIPCDTTRHSFKVNRTSFYIDDVLIGNLNSTYNFTETRTTYIFGWNTGVGTAKLIPTNARIYSFKIYDNGTLVRDYIPAKDDSEVICLYDKVTKAYFYNAGTGSFVAG